MKIVKKFFLVVFLSFFALITVFGTKIYFRDVQNTKNFWSLAKVKVASITLHADGYSDNSVGRVTNHYLTDWYIFPNSIEGKSTWLSKSEETVNGQFTAKVGIPTPWGKVGFLSKTEVIQISFGPNSL
ncbi:MAG: hypothetical protein FWC41_02015 [Firmicutes bacterium]|nr:hypothetical protein [Bacillota bacterium]